MSGPEFMSSSQETDSPVDLDTLSFMQIYTDVSACLSVRLPVFHTRQKGLKTFFSICCDLHNLSSSSSVPCVGYTIKEILADSIYMSHHLSNNYLASPGSIVR